jgi:hypothetical protein
MTKKHVSVVSVSAMLALLLTQFQNCAPARSVAGADATTDYTDSRVSMDGVGTKDIAFALSKVELRDDATSAAVGGLCDRSHEGAHLSLSVVDGAQAIDSAVGTCTKGQFSIDLSNVESLVCGVPHQLVVEGDWGGSAAVQFERRCQPVMSQVVDPGDSPAGTLCQLEYAPAAAAGCQRVCYRLDQVINTTVVDADQCHQMATQLAGP